MYSMTQAPVSVGAMIREREGAHGMLPTSIFWLISKVQKSAA
jgi:hypothetical protein